ncbi:transposase, partial [Nonomuraea soli]|uniref:transposase n=2 Tax=Nonomuraea soli TaxID=1032476 RepID=UPI0031ECF7A0
MDRRLYLPEHSWLAEPEPRRGAGVPEGAAFATKPALAAAMIDAALDAGLPAQWVSGDEVSGQAPRLRGLLEQRGISYVLAIAGNRRVNLGGTDRSAAADGPGEERGYPVRGWKARHRHITLAVLALAVLALAVLALAVLALAVLALAVLALAVLALAVLALAVLALA